MAACWPPLAAPTITDRAVAMKNALPRPHTARSATSWPIESAIAHARVASTISTRPVTTVRFAPKRALNAPVISIATTCTPR